MSEWNMALARAGTPHASTNQRAASLNLSANQVAGKPVTKMSLFFPTSKVKFTMSNDFIMCLSPLVTSLNLFYGQQLSLFKRK